MVDTAHPPAGIHAVVDRVRVSGLPAYEGSLLVSDSRLPGCDQNNLRLKVKMSEYK